MQRMMLVYEIIRSLLILLWKTLIKFKQFKSTTKDLHVDGLHISQLKVR